MVITIGAHYINKRPTEEPWIKELKSTVELTQISSLHIVCMSLTARKRVSCAHKHVHVLRTKDGARVFIFVFSLVASLGKYALRIQNPYLVIDYSIENGIAVVYWRGGGW